MSSLIREDSFIDGPVLLAGPERQLYIYRDNSGELLWRESEVDGWSEVRPPLRRGDHFSAALDAGRTPHIVMLDQSTFYHLQLLDGAPAEEPFYQEESKQCSHFLMGGDLQGMLHLIYLAVDDRTSRWWLLHHRRSKEKWEEPRVIDFGGGASKNYGAICLDRNDSVHLVYRIIEQNESSLYYRYFDPEALNWSKALPLSSAPSLSCPSISIDQAQNLHVVWCAKEGSQYYVKYRIMSRGGWPAAGWKQEVAISPALPRQPIPFFSYDDGNLIMAWFDENTLHRFRLGKGGWEKIEQEQFARPVLIRCNSLTPPAAQLHYRLAVEDGADSIPLPDRKPERIDLLADLDPDFAKLEQYSGNIVDKASILSSNKSRLERSLAEKRRELTSLSLQNEKTVRALKQNLSEKDRELQDLENKFNQSVKNLKLKTEQARKTWEAERKRYLGELKDLRRDHQQFERILQEKENTIARLETRCREQERRVKQLMLENEALEARVKESGWNIKKLLGKMLHNKP